MTWFAGIVALVGPVVLGRWMPLLDRRGRRPPAHDRLWGGLARARSRSAGEEVSSGPR